MVVDDADGLHPGVDDGRADELESAACHVVEITLHERTLGSIWANHLLRIELFDDIEVFYNQFAMRLFGLTVGAMIIVASAISCAAPDLRLALERSAMTPARLYAIAALRIVLGLMFVLAAPASRAPWLVRALGVIVIVAGLMTPWFGVARAQAVVEWLMSAGPWPMRLDAVIGMTLGGFLVYMFRSAPTRTRPIR